MSYECVLNAWHDNSDELAGFLTQRAVSPEEAEDLLQEVFVRAMREGNGFCGLDNPKAWLFRVARNQLIDRQRLRKPLSDLSEITLETHNESRSPVSELQQCIARNLPELEEHDRHILQACDLDGMTHNDYASHQGLSLPATKARVRRARQRLRALLVQNCNIILDEQGRVCCHRALSVLDR
ncbi:RNA polymerase subunit sigma-70 [Halovibrio salipaludis]|uniref:RNA polymerase sigma factor n=1 Tax=Halovibrio salipaludis TaxID=2032626 RepID=A0A2A2F985_9GAMM|nr:sigma-70 family RNA polymerase sigma factor [Halovibrio salipaludis]PAU81113.1 RNA polymerase subunit sigma-70 [Halovibrio salipaludis]